jgi:hypothetical protein
MASLLGLSLTGGSYEIVNFSLLQHNQHFNKIISSDALPRPLIDWKDNLKTEAYIADCMKSTMSLISRPP